MEKLEDRGRGLKSDGSVKTNSIGAHKHDGSEVRYTPGDAADWDAGDPGNADDGLDELAMRVKDIEGGAGAGSHTVLSAAHTDSDAADVPADGDVLTYDIAAGKWKAVAPTGGGDVATDAIWDAAGDLAVGTGADTAAVLSKPSPTEVANTTPSAFTNWASQAGNARKTLMFDSATGAIEWDYLTAIDVLTPAQVLTFTVQPAAAGYPDDTSGSAMVASSGTDTPRFAMTYQGTPTNADIDIQSETYAGNPEVNVGDYTVDAPLFTSLDGPAINRGAAVSESVTFRLTATVDGQTKTKDVTLTYLNERIWGVSNVDINTNAEIDTFRTAQNKELSNSISKSFTVTAGAGEYIYWIQRVALATPTFTVGGFEGGFNLYATVSWTNPRGFVEDYEVWRSDATGLGATTVVVS